MVEFEKLDDRELLRRLSDNDEKALAALYDRYWKRMLVRALSRLECLEDAEEIVNDAFVDLWKSRKNLEIRNALPTYLSAIVKYKVLARLASAAKMPVPESELSLIHIPDDSTLQTLHFAELQAIIKTAINDLPEKCQLVFRLSREKGLSDHEIATELNLSQKTVEGHITNALRKLRTSLSHFLFLLLLLSICTQLILLS